MKERRPLVEGLKPPAPAVDAAIEAEFVFGKPPVRPPENRTKARAPITTRIRSDYAEALKKASLKRQLDGITPNTLQAILEEALEPWLSKHGYLS